jgi:hypothetical protein
MMLFDYCWLAVSLVSSWSCWSSFRPAFSAVNWPVWVGFEWNFTFLTAFRTGCFEHFFPGHYFSTPCFLYGAKIGFCTLHQCITLRNIRFVLAQKFTSSLETVSCGDQHQSSFKQQGYLTVEEEKWFFRLSSSFNKTNYLPSPNLLSCRLGDWRFSYG